ncbi:MAG: hypothetical protein EZS28_012006 [Streblomastix strix]|uniref:Uncharacterized protein n=1 Tax=Streblomastix strix TaxID=222440 RepID=A0A5J4WCR6_9EUKA|nr:MAG: hypothetical protein EZS28_012006 [Streblomastix strix]
MDFFSKTAIFRQKILEGIKHAAQLIAPTLHKELSTVAGPVGMTHPGIGGAIGHWGKGGFYSDGAKVYWREKPITLSSASP